MEIYACESCKTLTYQSHPTRKLVTITTEDKSGKSKTVDHHFCSFSCASKTVDEWESLDKAEKEAKRIKEDSYEIYI